MCWARPCPGVPETPPCPVSVPFPQTVDKKTAGRERDATPHSGAAPLPLCIALIRVGQGSVQDAPFHQNNQNALNLLSSLFVQPSFQTCHTDKTCTSRHFQSSYGSFPCSAGRQAALRQTGPVQAPAGGVPGSAGRPAHRGAAHKERAEPFTPTTGPGRSADWQTPVGSGRVGPSGAPFLNHGSGAPPTATI